MKNLVLWNVSAHRLDDILHEKSVTCLHNRDGITEVFICTDNLVRKFDDGVLKWKKELTGLISADNAPVNAAYLSIINKLCVSYSNGEIITIDEDGSDGSQVGLCDSGLLALEWSPDQDLFVIVTRDMKSILMTCTFDPVHEVNLLSEDFGESQFITVGWGKKETQFHGSEGKQAAKSKSDVIHDDKIATQDNRIIITWRGDCNMYAIGFTIDGLNIFKVFNNEGILQFTSEKHTGLESNLSWRPSGNVIAKTQKLNDKYLVAFFEKNGLKHGDFTLPVNLNSSVEYLLWSYDSEILAIQCTDLDTDNQKILLFTSSNYNWYLKQNLYFTSKQKISKIMWDTDFELINNKKLHVFLNDGCHYSYTWVWNINHSVGNTANDDAVVTVIEGKRLLISAFRYNVIPPPMAGLEIELDYFVNSVHFASQNCKDIDTNGFLVCTADNRLILFKQKRKTPLEYDITNSIDLENFDFPLQYYNWYWLSDDTIICIKLEDNCCKLIEWNIKTENDIIQNNVQVLPGPVTCIHSNPTSTSSVYLQLISGVIVKYQLGGNMEMQNASFSGPCPKFSVLQIENTLYFLGLSLSGSLFLNGSVILNQVSSYFVHSHFILLTTLQHVFICAELSKLGFDNILEYNKNRSDNVYSRKIERGAKLVIAVSNDTRSVFQLPRGNLETIQPRPLSLQIIGQYLDSLKYYEAFDLLRKERINLNLIYDHDPSKFLLNVNVFLETINNNSWLNLFISDLENVDVTKTMYSSSYLNRKEQPQQDLSRKVNIVCDLIRTHLMKRTDFATKVLPTLTTYVKKKTDNDIEHALLHIKRLKLEETSGSKLPVSSDEALKFLLYMVEVNHLFDVALGMYDFELVLLVANKSQKDPKEYIPMLTELNEMEENYKKFTINKHLKRYDKAVEYLTMCGADKYNELKTFVKYHSLYRAALKHFSPTENVYKEISDDFGLHLKLKKQFTEAGIVYERARIFDKAIECYKEALEWELVIMLAKTWYKDRLEDICLELVILLHNEKRNNEALTILQLYCKNQEHVILFAIKNGHYKTALRLCKEYNKSYLIDKELVPALLEDYANTYGIIENNWTNFIRYTNRLRVVRENKFKNPTESYDQSFANKDCDLYSEAGSTLASTASKGSGRSFRSSKNRRKHERKVASLKEGSQYEDVALVMTLYNLVTSSFDLRLQVKEINIALIWLDKCKDAHLLQVSMERLLKEMKDSFKDIWTNQLVIEATNAAINTQNNISEGISVIPLGVESLEPHMRIAPVIQDIGWKLESLQ